MTSPIIPPKTVFAFDPAQTMPSKIGPGKVNTGGVAITFDAMHDVYRLSVVLPEMGYSIAGEQVQGAPSGAKKSMARMVAKQFARMVQERLEQQIYAALCGADAGGASDHKPAIHNPYASKTSFADLVENDIQEIQKSAWAKLFGDFKADTSWDQFKPEPMNLDVYKKLINDGFLITQDEAYKSVGPPALPKKKPGSCGDPDCTVCGGENPWSMVMDDEDPATMPTKAKKNKFVAPLHDAIPGFATMQQSCPVPQCINPCAQSGALLQHTIIHLNDGHKWTREEIADWLETLDHDLTLHAPEEVKDDEHHD